MTKVHPGDCAHEWRGGGGDEFPSCAICGVSLEDVESDAILSEPKTAELEDLYAPRSSRAASEETPCTSY